MNGCVLMAPSHTIQQLSIIYLLRSGVLPREGIDLLHLIQEFGGIVQRSVCMPDSILSWIQSKRKIVSDIKQQRHSIKQGLLLWQWKSVQFCFLCFFPKHLLNKLLTTFKLCSKCALPSTLPVPHTTRLPSISLYPTGQHGCSTITSKVQFSLPSTASTAR